MEEIGLLMGEYQWLPFTELMQECIVNVATNVLFAAYKLGIFMYL
jgi:hypothetical protein